MRRPKMIIFDYGHTLYDESKFNPMAGSEAVLACALANPEMVTAQMLVAKANEMNGFIGRYDPGKEKDYLVEYPNIAFIRYLYDFYALEFDRPLSAMETVFWDHAAPGVPTEGILDLLAYLKAAGIRTAVISNLAFSGTALDDRISQAMDPSQFEFILSTADYLYRKPSYLIYELALKKAGLSADQVWYCGDNVYCDVEGASAVGIQPIWYTGANDTGVYNGKPDMDIVPEQPACEHIRVSDWKDMMKLLREAEE